MPSDARSPLKEDTAQPKGTSYGQVIEYIRGTLPPIAASYFSLQP